MANIVADDFYINKTLVSLVQLKAIPTVSLNDNAIVIYDGYFYYYSSGSVATANDLTVVFPDSSVGRWLIVDCLKNISSAAVDPTINDDYSSGFVAGDRFLNTTTEFVHDCVSSAVGAAVWMTQAYQNKSNVFTQSQTFLEDISIAINKKVITPAFQEAVLDAGIKFFLGGINCGTFYNYTGQWFSMSGSGTPDDGTNLYIPRISSDHWYFGWMMADTDMIYMGKGMNQFILTGDGQLKVQMLELSTGAQINQFSTSGIFAGAADTLTYTGLAIKTYVDAHASKFNLSAGVITPITTSNNLNLPSGEYRFNSNILPVDGNPDHWLIGANHSKYTSIATALSNIADSASNKPYLLTLSNGTFVGNLDFATDSKEYICLDGAFALIRGAVSTYDNVVTNVFEIISDTGGHAFHKAGSQTGHSYLHANKVDVPTPWSAVCAASGVVDVFADWIITKQGFCLGTIAADQNASLNVFVNQLETIASVTETGKLVASGHVASDISLFANKMVCSNAAGTSYVFDLDHGVISAFINSATDFDYFLDQDAGYSYLTSNLSEGVIDIGTGIGHISSLEHVGNIIVGTGTLYANILNHSAGTVTYTPGQILGRIGNDFYSSTSKFLTAKARDAASRGGEWFFEGAASYGNWSVGVYQDIFKIECDIDSADYEVRVENIHAARTAKIYNDELAGTNGTVYANAGYLTTTDPSDESLKENIELFSDPNMVSKFKRLVLRDFNYKIDGSAKTSYVAQEVEIIEPRLVKESNMPVGYISRESSVVDPKTGELSSTVTKKTKFERRKGLNLDLMARYHEYVTIQLINRIEILEAKIGV